MNRKARQRSAPARASSRDDQDPVLAMLAAVVVDDEPVSDDDRRHIVEGRQAYREGRIVSAEEVRQACRDARSDAARNETNQVAPV